MRKLIQSGFTLIEIMFVIAILAVVSAIGLNTYKQRTENAKLDRASLQIQQILQSGSAYYVNHVGDTEPWPNSITQIEFRPYLPFGGSDTAPLNPWGHDYQTITPGSQQLRFGVTTVLPSEKLAQRLASKLPNAEVTGKTVDAEITIPGQAEFINTKTVVVASMGHFELNNANNHINTIQFTCPKGAEGDIFTAISAITPSKTTIQTIPVTPIYTAQTVKQSCLSTGDENDYRCTISTSLTGPTAVNGVNNTAASMGTITINYLTMCKPI